LSAEPDSDGDSEGQDTDGYPSVADIGELLQLLPQLPKLTHLDLWGLAGSKTPVPQWTCLGRCTGLQVLRLQNLFIHKDSWSLMFEGAQLCRLRKLRLHICSEVSDSADEIYVPMPRQVVQQMVDACPNLEVLQLVGNGLLSSGGPNRLPEVRQSPPVSLAPLGQLQHLTSLRVHSVRTQVCVFFVMTNTRFAGTALSCPADVACCWIATVTILHSYRNLLLCYIVQPVGFREDPPSHILCACRLLQTCGGCVSCATWLSVAE
jgi:hypothetical protein